MTLAEGLARLDFDLPSNAESRLSAYLALLTKWNRVYNLTAVRNTEQMVTHHLLDSLVVLPHLSSINTLLDVGSGAGLPGLVLAMMRPDLQVTSVEANQKKSAFQQQVIIELGLSNVRIHCGRVEVVQGHFDAAISRAFADIHDFIRLSGHLTNRLLAMKGVVPQQELSRLPSGWTAAVPIGLSVPGLAAERHLIVLEKA